MRFNFFEKKNKTEDETKTTPENTVTTELNTELEKVEGEKQ